MDRVKLSILGISYNQTRSGAYALILSEEKGKRRVPIIIGASEAQAIAIHLEGLKPPRPLTHDLFLSFAEAFNIALEEIFIYNMKEGVFFSEIVFNDGKNRIRVDARTSDSVALAIRFDAPVYISPKVLDEAGLEIEVKEEFPLSVNLDDDLSEDDLKIADLENSELQIALEEAINDENYELAKILNEELDNRKKEE